MENSRQSRGQSAVSFGAGCRTPRQRCQETVSQGKTSSRQGCQTDRSTLQPCVLASVKVKLVENSRQSRGQSAVSWRLCSTADGAPQCHTAVHLYISYDTINWPFLGVCARTHAYIACFNTLNSILNIITSKYLYNNSRLIISPLLTVETTCIQNINNKRFCREQPPSWS